MKRHAPCLILAILLGIAPAVFASQHDAPARETDTRSTQEVQQELSDAGEAIKRYTVDKRDEASSRAKAALDALDARIDTLESEIDANWDRMDEAARRQARKTLQALHAQRVRAAEWYGGMKNSTAEAWEQMKKGFSDAYQSLQGAWEKAEQSYRKDAKP